MSYQIHKIDHTISRLPLKLLYITHSSYDKGWHSTQHAHNFIELFYIISGEGAFIVDHEEKYNNLSFNDQPEPQISANILQIKQYIDLNYSDNITLQTLADISHLSKYYISHSFKEEIGQSPIDYLNTQRIENAKILLESTNYSITEIARFTGFSSQSFFS